MNELPQDDPSRSPSEKSSPLVEHQSIDRQVSMAEFQATEKLHVERHNNGGEAHHHRAHEGTK